MESPHALPPGPDPDADPLDLRDARDDSFDGYVVAIGASAGGLEALERLFDGLPGDSGAAFVVIQHLSPDHKSMMDNLLSRHTPMPVVVATHGMPLSPNQVFLIPPGMQMTVTGGRLQLARKPEHGLSLPIDVFFRSLAQQYGDRALAVVLSGTGSDGARGLVTVNEQGGVVMVQSPESAKFDGMPRSAIATGLADEVLAPGDLATRIEVLLRQEPPRPRTRGSEPLQEEHIAALDAVLQTLVTASGINFREYKPATVIRRIERRMQVLHCRSFADYIACLRADPGEIDTLRRELLIPVTRFFREPEVFEQIGTEVLPQIIQRHVGKDPIRIWIAGCSTGEEAYTVAMLFAEACDRMQRWPEVKIFATDVEQEYLDFASAGTYPETIAAEVSPTRLERFFTHRAGSYAVKSELRKMMIFARHNLVEDPPFTRMDLVTCRNVQIYLQPAAQQVLMSRLHYALAPRGVMLLGSSESLGPLHGDFAVISAKHKIYSMLRRGRAVLATAGSAPGTSLRDRRARVQRGGGSEASLQQVALGMLLRDFAPAALLVTSERALVHVFGDARRFLRLPEGDATLDVVSLLPTELAGTVAAMLHVAVREGGERHAAAITVRCFDGETAQIRPVVRVLPDEVNEERGILIVLEPVNHGETVALPIGASDVQVHLKTLEAELAATRANLQTTIEDLETANEELQATNEELIASNEELQSTNEELQSVNEELFTVNAEYQEKVDVLNRVNADLENMLRAAASPTLFVDEELRLARFTPEAAQLFKIQNSDVGRLLEDFANLLDYPELFADLRRAVADGRRGEREVRARDGRWLLAHIQPYALSEQRPRRAVITLTDVSRLKDAQRLQAVIDSLPEHIAVLDAAGTIVVVNQAWRDFAQANGDFGLTATGPGANYLRACAACAPNDREAQRAYSGLSDVLAGRAHRFTLQYPCHSPEEQRWFLMHAAPLQAGAGGAVVSHINVSEFMTGRPGIVVDAWPAIATDRDPPSGTPPVPAKPPGEQR